ncbi:hypothetical protein AaE_013120 [Aphanomyces astaci]|uniref:HAT C-terminal dimerisation domain-containing protein n=1 Tax=Aphanomyces astaci TaxID=112090 RepID=A0A6A4Z8M9_APHAT|nr:hypothetical protein AaE_013120 [Aphanomyces astaci]
MAGIPLIGCASHRFNLAVSDYIGQSKLVAKINTLMLKLKNLLPAAKLRQFTPLVAKTRNVTRWSSTFAMVSRYRELRPFLQRIDDDDIAALMLTAREDRQADELLNSLTDLDSVTLLLQRENLYLDEVRSVFDVVLDEHPAMNYSNCPKCKNCREFDLTPQERASAVSLLKRSATREATTAPASTLAERAAIRMANAPAASDYMDLRFLRPTSNICERFFSVVKHALSDNRSRILPKNIEAQMFLHFNAEFWTAEDIRDLTDAEVED